MSAKREEWRWDARKRKRRPSAREEVGDKAGRRDRR